MPAAITDLFLKASANWVGAIGSGGVADGTVTTIPLVSTTNLPTTTAIEITVDRVDANGTETPSKMEVIKGIVSSNNIISCERGKEGTAQAHSAGAIVEVMLTADMWNSMIDAMIAGHTQTGVHDGTTISVPVHAADSKTTPVDADEIGIIDSEASNVLKKLTWANLKATLVKPRTNTTTSSATPTINTDTTDIFTITALAEDITSMTTNLSGTPVNGQKLIIRIKDDGTARAITWGASFASRGATLPTTTVLGKYLYVGLIYNSTASVWDCVATAYEL